MERDDLDSRTLSIALPSTGSPISHYEIDNKLGSGGMGEVYLARDTLLERQVAIKFLSPLLANDKKARGRFEREARAAARINHRNVVMIHDVGEYDRRPYIIMEYVDGIPLDDKIRTTSTSIDEAVTLSTGIAEGLYAAHRQAVVHRDLKPANILIDAGGTPKIADFGLAVVRDVLEQSTSGTILGTVGYMSPEQACGSAVDERSDVFSLGVIIYELLTGVSPFRGNSTAESLAKLLHHSLVPPFELRNDIPGFLNEIVVACLNSNPADRVQSASEVAERLRDASVQSKRRPATSLMDSTAKRRLAVIPFEDYMDKESQHNYGEMISTLLITGLSEQRVVSVVSHQRLIDLLSLDGQHKQELISRADAIRLARRAGAQHLLTGCVLQQSPLLVTAQLIEVHTGDVVGGFRVAGQPDDALFGIVDSLQAQLTEHFEPESSVSHSNASSVTDVTTNSPEAYRCYLEGERLFSQVYEDKARAAYEEAISHDPTFAMAYYSLARMTTPDRAALMSKAVRYSERATDKERHYILSFQARLHGRHQEALDHLQSIIQKYPDEKHAHFLAGAMIHRWGRHQEAVEYVQKAIELDPLFCMAYNQLAYCYSLAGRFEDALWAINQYVNLTPDEPNPYDSRAEILTFHGKVDAAITSFQEALQRKADMPPSLLRLAACYILTKRYQEARDCYIKVAALSRQYIWTDPLIYPAFILLRQGKLGEATEQLAAGIEEDSLDPGRAYHIANKRYQLGSILFQQGEDTAALVEVDQGLECYRSQKWFGPDFCTSQINDLRLRILLRLNRYHEVETVITSAERDLGSATDANWLDLMDYNIARATLMFHRRDFTGIASASTKILNRMSRWPGGRYFTYLRLLARSYIELDRPDRAIELLHGLINTYAESRMWHALDDVSMHYYLGLAYEQSGWTEKAIEQYQILVDVWRDADTEIEELTLARDRLSRLKV